MGMDVLQAASSEQVMEGVTLYRFTTDAGVAQGEYVLNQNGSTGRCFNLIFCRSGVIRLRCRHCADRIIGGKEIVLLSDRSDVVSVVVQTAPEGYCLSIDSEVCSGGFGGLYRMLGQAAWRWEAIRALLHKNEECLQIKHSSWKQSVFSILDSLPDTQQGGYCLLKAAELWYLLPVNQSMYNEIIPQTSMPDYLVEQLTCIGTYIENHLDENLTISLLCQKFNLSASTLKNKFREFYGQPIHNWIQYRRIRRAAQLLLSSDMTVLQIAQSVGYESVSQFNVIFRRTYGTTPSLYKKMSNTVKN